jgi:hypothetical protein
MQLDVRFGLRRSRVASCCSSASPRACARVGTLLNVFVIGAVLDVLLTSRCWPTRRRAAAGRLLATLGGSHRRAGSALYLAPPRARTPRRADGRPSTPAPAGASAPPARVLECVVLVLGVLLGGPVGIGTVLFALGIGPACAGRLPRAAPDARCAVRWRRPHDRAPRDQPAGQAHPRLLGRRPCW